MDTSRYARQIAAYQIGATRQQRLANSRVVIVGCGALGSVSASLLVRAGVSHVRLIDRDFVELHNLQRQLLYDEEDVRSGLPKAVAASRKLQAINSDIWIEGIVADFNGANAESLLSQADVVVDAIDNFEGRYLINDVCVRNNIPWVYGAVIGAYGVTMNILPGRTPCLRCLFPDAPAPGTVDTCDTAGILGSTVAVISGLQVMETIKLLAGADNELNPGLLQVDVWDGEMQRTIVPRQAECPTCVHQEFTYLDAVTTSQTTSLCGRDAIQITLPNSQRLDMNELATRLCNVGEVTVNSFMLRLVLDDYELNIFPDARIIVKGTTDEVIARGLYAKYVGL